MGALQTVPPFPHSPMALDNIACIAELDCTLLADVVRFMLGRAANQSGVNQLRGGQNHNRTICILRVPFTFTLQNEPHPQFPIPKVHILLTQTHTTHHAHRVASKQRLQVRLAAKCRRCRATAIALLAPARAAPAWAA